MEEKRKAWIAVLNRADVNDLVSAKQGLKTKVDYEFIVRPETGMIMGQAKADGNGARFNLGEITVSRCVLKLKENCLGVSCILGSDLVHAELAAYFDGLLQLPEYQDPLFETLIDPLKAKLEVQDLQKAEEAKKTKVEFFTMKKGE